MMRRKQFARLQINVIIHLSFRYLAVRYLECQKKKLAKIYILLILKLISSTSFVQVIQGNSNTYLESKHELKSPLWASKIRFVPYSYHRRTVCMRVEIYGCPWKDGIVSYSMPQGDKRNSCEFFDTTYDGHWDGQLVRGLGQLTDGMKGPDTFKTCFYDSLDRNQGWVGWKNDSRSGHPLEIKFEFDDVREFSAVHIYCNNQFTKDVQVRFV